LFTKNDFGSVAASSTMMINHPVTLVSVWLTWTIMWSADAFELVAQSKAPSHLLASQQVQDFGRQRSDAKFQQRSKRWIVLVDDEEQIRQSVGRYLFERGYQVTACPDAKTALRVSRTRTVTQQGVEVPKLPDVIVSDVRMPEMNGLEFVQEIRNDPRLVSIPVVLLTAKGMTQDRIAGYRAGADAYIPKPFDPEELLSVIDKSILRHETLSEDNVAVDDLRQDLEEIKYLLLEQGGAGVGNGWVEDTSVFLAPDERRVLELLCQGMYNQEIADEMILSKSRVEAIISEILRKTNLSNRTQLVRWAVATGNVKI
jgi:DNA-binding NarL/FixJ family response regulator